MLDVHSIACSRPAAAGRKNVSGARGSDYKKVNNKENNIFWLWLRVSHQHRHSQLYPHILHSMMILVILINQRRLSLDIGENGVGATT